MFSGPSTCYWVLPCCPFTFTAKFQRRQAQLSVFRDFLNFVREIGQLAGFNVAEDRMRIPSTKRVCFVGKPADPEDGVAYAKRKQHLLAYLATQPGVARTAAEAPEAFQPRERVERVRNCTQLDRTLVSGIVAHVVELCLAAEEGKRHIDLVGGRSWNAGGNLGLSCVADRLAQAGWDLSQLKAECGGLQTLLRNHHAVFTVRGGRVRLKVPGEEDAASMAASTSRMKARKGSGAASRQKTKACWHYLNHPDGCPLTAESCRWLHA